MGKIVEIDCKRIILHYNIPTAHYISKVLRFGGYSPNKSYHGTFFVPSESLKNYGFKACCHLQHLCPVPGLLPANGQRGKFNFPYLRRQECRPLKKHFVLRTDPAAVEAHPEAEPQDWLTQG
eukprot:63049-Amphidinium_carterae.1